jgi:hypothetical protein
MQPVIAMPSHKRGQKMAYSFDEDGLSLAWDAVRAARLSPGTKLAVAETSLPGWWWQGTGLVCDPAAALQLRPVATTVGPAVCIHPAGAAPDIEDEAKRIHALAPNRPEAEWQRHRLARDAPDTEADFPLGAYVTPSRHEQVTAQRMQSPGGVVRSWTLIGAGAAPTEFGRLQDAAGAYAVVLVERRDGSRTVGLWAGAGTPRTGDAAEPVLRRLLRTQGAWRHGVKYRPPPETGSAPPPIL